MAVLVGGGNVDHVTRVETSIFLRLCQLEQREHARQVPYNSAGGVLKNGPSPAAAHECQ